MFNGQKNKRLLLDYGLISIAIAFFFCMNQYNGNIVDSILYTLQAVNFVHPERFINDVSFMYGNQDSFTFFSPLYAFFINLFGVSQAALLLCVLSHLLFAASFSFLIYSWFNKFHCRKYFFPFLILFFALYRFGELRTVVYPFKLVEPYLVPRTYSVAFAILGLGFFYSNKKISLALIIFGSLFNPLMAGWALPLWLFFYFPRFITPIVLGSVLFPLTIFLRIGPFDKFDTQWYLTCPAIDFYFVRLAIFGFFYIWGYFVFKNNFTLKKIFRALSFVWGIAFYWLVAARTTHHIFLNQAQLFRIDWLCVTTTFPLLISVFFRYYVLKFRKNYHFSKTDCFLFVFPLLFWIDSIFIDCCLLYTFVRIKGFRVKNVESLYTCVRILLIIIVVLIGLIELFRMTDIKLFDEYQAKEYIRLLGFVGVITIGVMYFKKMCSKRIAFTLLILFAIAIFSFTLLQFEEKSIAEVAVLAMLTMVWIYPMRFLKKGYLLIPFLWLIPYIIVHYDARMDAQINAEERSELFWEELIFPSVKNRGRILFMTGGFHFFQPRFQFLTGAYIDDQSFPGGLLFRAQFIEASHRLSMLLFEQERMPHQYEYRDFPRKIPKYWEALYNADSLKKKYSFLCLHKEIEYLATDVELKEEHIVDFYKFPESEWKINLYKCGR